MSWKQTKSINPKTKIANLEISKGNIIRNNIPSSNSLDSVFTLEKTMLLEIDMPNKLPTAAKNLKQLSLKSQLLSSKHLIICHNHVILDRIFQTHRCDIHNIQSITFIKIYVKCI